MGGSKGRQLKIRVSAEILDRSDIKCEQSLLRRAKTQKFSTLLVNLHHLATILKGSKTVATDKRSATRGEQSAP